MAQQYPESSTQSPSSMPEGVLSDEEIQAQAAAFAQRVYEQQIMALRAQRDQLLAAWRAQEEYVRQMNAYEQSVDEYFAQQGGVPAVQIDSETGAQTYPTTQNSAEEVVAEPEAKTNPVNEAGVPVEEPEVASSVEVSPEIIPEQEASFEENSTEENFLEENSPAPTVPRKKRSVPALLILLIVLCVADIIAFAYVMWSGDPRCEIYRDSILSLFDEKYAEKRQSPVPATIRPRIPDDPRTVHSTPAASVENVAEDEAFFEETFSEEKDDSDSADDSDEVHLTEDSSDESEE